MASKKRPQGPHHPSWAKQPIELHTLELFQSMEKKGSLMTNVSVDTEDKQSCERLRGGHGGGGTRTIVSTSSRPSTGVPEVLLPPLGNSVSRDPERGTEYRPGTADARTAERDQPSGVWPARSDPLTGPAELLAPACPPPTGCSLSRGLPRTPLRGLRAAACRDPSACRDR